MKLRVLSDLHLEFSRWQYNYHGEDAVLIAGDIVSRSTDGGRPLFQLLRSIPVPVFFCLGNHDYYGTKEFKIFPLKIKNELINRNFNHVHFLHNEFIDFGGFRFCGTPLFTDFSLYGITNQYHAMRQAEELISDFTWIQHSSEQRIKGTDYIGEYQKAVRFLSEQIERSPNPLVFMTHWVPLSNFIAPQYKDDASNPYFVNNLPALVDDKVKLWHFGHTHTPFDSVLGNTRFICNPRGYPGEGVSWQENLVIEI